jgi:hypothetical protein
MTAGAWNIEFSGRAAERLGIAVWQADGSGPERAAIGHAFDTPIGRITSHYYIASRDHVDPGAAGGVVGIDLHGKWPHLRESLAEHRRSVGDLLVRLPLTTAGNDKEGKDWFYRDDVETRYLAPRTAVPLDFCHTPLLQLPVERLMLTETYKGATSFADVRLALVSDPAEPQRAARLEGAARDVANALLADLGGRRLRIVVDAIVLIPESFDGDGRIDGRYADLPMARLEVL